MTVAALHEVRHALAAAVASQYLGVSTKGLETVIADEGDGNGSFTIIPVGMSRESFESVMALASLGPCIAHPKAELAILKAGAIDHPALEPVYFKAGLSDDDARWRAKWTGSFTAAATVVAATRALDARLGTLGRAKLCRVVTALGKTRTDRGLMLDTLCPPRFARRALATVKLGEIA
ncbi:hypothetical protein [Paracoccus ravus]|uniref:hypothetical protein n=1 Tax=Paracoccus ravus TaxID=2447760 RepID=UPI00106E16D6|nr:hypothetical protein [Paracoccus ravus]